MIKLDALGPGLALSPLDADSLPVARDKTAESPRQEASELLGFAAEVEHALMLQYLYAAYSVRCDQDEPLARNQAISIRRFMLQIAREEMGHLMTVQNLLRAIGAPLHLGRTPALERCGHPFHFTLEPLSSRSLAKYVTAERPHHVPDPALRRKLDDIAAVARHANRGRDVTHMGGVYARLLELFGKSDTALADADFRTDTDELRARWSDWGYDGAPSDTRHPRLVHVDALEADSVPALRKRALKALHDILEQGEGYQHRDDSHYDRFLQLYDLVLGLEQRQVELTWPVAVNPSTVPATSGSDGETSYIESAAAHRWAQLCNVRYRLLLGYLHHFLYVPGPRYVQKGEGVPEALGDHSPRGLLLKWAFDEMRHLSKIAAKLINMPLRTFDDGVRAGPPFELPEDVAVLDEVPADPHGGALWQAHARILDRSRTLVQGLLGACAPGATDPFLEDLQAEDEKAAQVLAALAAGQGIPEGYHPRKFQKVAHVLEQAGRGFAAGPHGSFWADINRDEFVKTSFYGLRFLGFHPDDPSRFSAANSFLAGALEGAMPAFRPPVDESRRSFVKQWIDGQAQDGDPPGRIGVHHERDPILDHSVPPGSADDTED